MRTPTATVEGVSVSGILQAAVPHGIDGLEPLTRRIGAGHTLHRHKNRSALDADPLGGHAYPRVAGAHDLLFGARPFRIGVDAATDVEPLDDDGAAELRGVRRRAHQHTGSVSSTRVRCELPAAVTRQRTVDLVRRRRPCRGVLALHVSVALQIGRRPFAKEHTFSTGQLGRHIRRRSERARRRRHRSARRGTTRARPGVALATRAGHETNQRDA